MRIEVKNGVGCETVNATGYSLKGISVKGSVDKIEMRLDGNIVYTFVNEEKLDEFSDNSIDIPLIGTLEIKVFAQDGYYDIYPFLSPFFKPTSKGAYEEMLLKK